MSEPTRSAGSSLPTVDFIPPPSTGPTRDLRAPVAVVAGSGPHLSTEMDALLRARLRAAALFLTIALGATVVRHVILADEPLWPLAALLSAALLAAAALLPDPRLVRPRWLRATELGIFGGVAALLALRQYQTILHWAARHDATSLALAVKNGLLGAIVLQFAYAMLIPNTWRRAARFVLGLDAVVLVAHAMAFLAHPRLIAFARTVATAERVSENVLFVLIAAALSIYGTHVINGLRREAFEARQLNQYRLGDRLGTGGMGEVYLAEHQMLKRPCALKLIRPEKAGDARALARFEREVRTTARLSHPNTVEIYDYGHTDDGTFYYVMELLQGLSLAELVERHGPLPPGRVIYLLTQACEALSEAHAAGLVHRDVKPANLFAARRGGRDDVAKVLDFGLVKVRRDDEAAGLSREGFVSGTPQYMAPEQVLADRAIDGRCDLYAMGAVAYCLLTGRPPFEGEGASRVMIAQARDPVTPPSRLRPDLPGDLERVVLRCLAKSPDDRYPDAESLRRALASCESAADWDAECARRWWREAEGSRLLEPRVR